MRSASSSASPDERLAVVQNEWIESALARGNLEREKQWSDAVAVGRRSFVEQVQEKLGARARYRHVEDVDGLSILRDGEEPYWPRLGGEIAALSAKSTVDFAES